MRHPKPDLSFHATESLIQGNHVFLELPHKRLLTFPRRFLLCGSGLDFRDPSLRHLFLPTLVGDPHPLQVQLEVENLSQYTAYEQ